MPWRSISRIALIPWVTVGILAGVGAAQVGRLWWDSLRPKAVLILGVDVEPLSDGAYKLEVRLIAPQIANCLRLSEHVISSRPVLKGSQYQPLAAAISGAEFTTGGLATIVLRVDPYMVEPGGRWYYIYRAAYQCTRFPGLLRVSAWQSPPVPIIFPDHQ